MKKEQYFRKALKWAENKGFTQIKAKHDSYPDPSSFSRVKDDATLTPDITGKKGESKHYVEIAVKSENVGKITSKWRLLSTFASRKGGKLFLLAPKGHKAFVQRLLNKYPIEAKLVYMPNI